jgi:glycosyltransferase involved in cell wall biosynthesis
VPEPQRPEISFVVIAHNEEANIGRCLAAIGAQDSPVSREVIVVDDGSADRTADVVREVAAADPIVRLLALPENRGRGAARKAGTDSAAGSYLAYVDADIVLPPDWLARCLEAIGDVDAVSGIAVPDGDLAYVYGRFALTPKPVPARTDVAGSNALFRRELFDRISFDPALREGEDVAFSHSLRDENARFRTLEDLLVRHEETKTFRQSVRWLYQSGKGAARQFYRYREVRFPDLVFAAWLGTCGATAVLARRSRAAWLLPAGYLAVGAGAHVAGAFEWRPAESRRFAGAIAVDMVLLGSYFTGRTVGLVLAARG